MKASQLKNKAIKSKSKNDLVGQKTEVVKLNKRCKKEFFDSLETNNHSNPFLSTCKPYFSNKHGKGDADILLIENNKILLNNRTIANAFNNYFQSVTKILDFFEWQDEPQCNIFDDIDIIINKFCYPCGIIKSKQKFGSKESLRLNRLQKSSLTS